MPKLAGDGLRRAGIVARDHRNLQPQRMQCPDRLRRGFLDRVGNGEDRRKLAVDRGIERRLALVASRAAISAKTADIQTELDHVAVGADVDPLSARRRRDAIAGDGVEASDLGQDQALGFGRRDDGAGDRVFGLRLDRRHHGQHRGRGRSRAPGA